MSATTIARGRTKAMNPPLADRTSLTKHQRGVPDEVEILSGKYYVVSDEKLSCSQHNTATNSKTTTKNKVTSNNDEMSLHETNKENLRETKTQDIPVSNLYLAMTHTKQKEAMEKKKARGVPNLT